MASTETRAVVLALLILGVGFFYTQIHVRSFTGMLAGDDDWVVTDVDYQALGEERSGRAPKTPQNIVTDQLTTLSSDNLDKVQEEVRETFNILISEIERSNPHVRVIRSPESIDELSKWLQSQQGTSAEGDT